MSIDVKRFDRRFRVDDGETGEGAVAGFDSVAVSRDAHQQSDRVIHRRSTSTSFVVKPKTLRYIHRQKHTDRPSERASK
jgi:hypothetical protein